MSKSEAEAEGTTGANHKARQSRVLHAVSRRRYHSSHEATGLCIARTVTAPEKETAATGEDIGTGGRLRVVRQKIHFEWLGGRSEKQEPMIPRTCSIREWLVPTIAALALSPSRR